MRHLRGQALRSKRRLPQLDETSILTYRVFRSVSVPNASRLEAQDMLYFYVLPRCNENIFWSIPD